MFLQGLDIIGATLALQQQIEDFQRKHWAARPWLQDIGLRTRERLAPPGLAA
jgi:3-isopropylmalate/(R)-2-methylmalate dehydratase small subunit